MTLPNSFLQSLITRIDDPNVAAITYAGSYARGQAGTHSDVDLQVYVRTMPESEYERYTLCYWDGYLVSLSTNTIEAERANLLHPEHALWAVPGLRQAVILLDKEGSLASLKQAAIEFNWFNLQPLADEYAVEQLMGYAEEVHKILNGLAREQESTVLYALLGLFKGLARAVAVQRGLLMESENRFFDVIQDSVGRNTNWTRAFRLAVGADPLPINQPSYRIRGAAALTLYLETAELFKNIITDKHRMVIEITLHKIQQAGF